MGLIIADTSIWIDHIDRPNPELAYLIRADCTLMHPLVLIEILLGNLAHWHRWLNLFRTLPVADTVPTDELVKAIDALKLQGSGLGATDAHLLASTLATRDCQLWTRDKRLAREAEKAGVAWSPEAN